MQKWRQQQRRNADEHRSQWTLCTCISITRNSVQRMHMWMRQSGMQECKRREMMIKKINKTNAPKEHAESAAAATSANERLWSLLINPTPLAEKFKYLFILPFAWFPFSWPSFKARNEMRQRKAATQIGGMQLTSDSKRYNVDEMRRFIIHPRLQPRNECASNETGVGQNQIQNNFRFSFIAETALSIIEDLATVRFGSLAGCYAFCEFITSTGRWWCDFNDRSIDRCGIRLHFANFTKRIRLNVVPINALSKAYII